MKRKLLWIYLFMLPVGMWACESDDTKESESSTAITTPQTPLQTPPTKWQGEQLHFTMMGKVGDYPVNIQLSNLAAPVEGAAPQIGFKREYEQAPNGEIRFTQIEVELQIVLGGIEREIDFELINANFDNTDMNAGFTIINGINEWVDGAETVQVTGQHSSVEFGMEWEEGDGEADVETKSSSGVALLSLAEGAVDTQGIIRAAANQRLGGYLNVSTETGTSVVISFTVPPIGNDDEIQNGVELSTVDNFYE